MQSIKKNKKSAAKGITLLETVIALGIMVVGLLAVLTLTISSVTISHTSEQQIVVTNLAREGIEIVREIRDFSKSGNVVSIFDSADTRFFDDGVNPVVSDGCYIVDSENNFALQTANQTVGADCAGGSFDISACSNCLIYKDVTSGRYSHDPSDELTVYRRAVKLVSVSAYEKQILSKVRWSERGRTHELLIETTLTDW